MRKRLLSRWSKHGEIPPSVGVWETDVENRGSPTYQHWNGEFYGYASVSPEEAERRKENRSAYKMFEIRFRGLVHRPNAQ